MKLVNLNGQEISAEEAMKLAVTYYNWIGQIGEQLATMCQDNIKPLLEEDKFSEARKAVKEFYKTSYIEDYSVFIEHDMIMANINLRKKLYGQNSP